MKVGISIPASISSAEPLFEWATQVDRGPFSTLSILDRLDYPNFEPMTTLAAVAAVTRRVRLMTEVLIAPVRNTAILAKESVTLDVLSNGRFSLGLGLGGREDDYIAAEVVYKDRGKRFDRQLEQMKRIWAGDPREAAAPIGPKSVQPGGPELILSGFAPKAFERTARYGDGFVTAANDLPNIEQAFRAVERSWQEAGRSGQPRLIAQIDIALETRHIGQGRQNVLDYYAISKPFDVYKSNTMLTTEQQIRDIIPALASIGADEVVFFTWSSEIEQVDRIANLIG
jgi:alkanesulfonate monooxygenase SsuD/methylene tetrahydromethanopterin reductase-like flavin-dependent oxidoreductase (luciferase family)